MGTFLGFVFTFLGFVVTSIALVINIRYSREISKNLLSLGSRLERVSDMMETTRLQVNLDPKAWHSYLKLVQEQAVSSDYLEPRKGRRVLTVKGRSLLTDLAKDIEELIDMTAANEVIFELGIQNLYNKAKEKRIPLDILIAVVNSYFEEIRDKKSYPI